MYVLINGNTNWDNHHSVPLLPKRNPKRFQARLGSNGPEETSLSSVWTPRTPHCPLKEVPLRPMDSIPPLEESEITSGGLRLCEARDFFRKARACSAPELNGISFKLYKKYPAVLEQLVCLLQRSWQEGYIAQEWRLADGVWITKEEISIEMGSFPPISPQHRRWNSRLINCQANDIIPPPEQIHQHVNPEG